MEQNKKQLSEASAESMKIINASREAANKIKDDIINKANEEYSKILIQAKDEIERQKVSAVESIKEEVVDLSIKVAEEIVRRNLNNDDQRNIVRDFISKIPKN